MIGSSAENHPILSRNGLFAPLRGLAWESFSRPLHWKSRGCRKDRGGPGTGVARGASELFSPLSESDSRQMPGRLVGADRRAARVQGPSMDCFFESLGLGPPGGRAQGILLWNPAGAGTRGKSGATPSWRMAWARHARGRDRARPSRGKASPGADAVHGRPMGNVGGGASAGDGGDEPPPVFSASFHRHSGAEFVQSKMPCGRAWAASEGCGTGNNGMRFASVIARENNSDAPGRARGRKKGFTGAEERDWMAGQRKGTERTQ